MAVNILEQLAEHARERVAEAKRRIPPEEMKAKAFAIAAAERQAATAAEFTFPFEQALRGERMAFICECKKASPSKGLIAPDFPYLEIAKSYEAAGASAISVLTEPGWFLGSDQYLKEIAAAVKIPCLRKDFTVDEYMIYEAKCLGAAAVLLICALLDTETLRRYIRICDTLGLSALVEAHDEAETCGCRRPDHRCEQPESEGFHGGFFQQHPAPQSDPGGCDLCGGERCPDPCGCGASAGSQGGRSPDRRDPDAGAGQAGDA